MDDNKPGIGNETFKIKISKDAFNIFSDIRKDFEITLL